MTLTITSTAFAPDGAIPTLYTCEGRDISPPLAWSGVPSAAKSLALVVDDPVRTAYGGPCPPIGRHRYFFKLYALDAMLPGLARPSKAALETAMQGHVLAQATLMGPYRKSR